MRMMLRMGAAAIVVSTIAACGPAEPTVSKDAVESAVRKYESLVREERGRWLRVIGDGIVIQVFPLAVGARPDRARLASLGVKMERMLSLNGRGLRAIHITVKENARKNPAGAFKPFLLSSYENNARRTVLREKAVVPKSIKDKYAKERMDYTFSNGTRTVVRVELYYNQEPLDAALKGIRAGL